MADGIGSDASLVASDTADPLDHLDTWRGQDPTGVCLAQANGRLPAFWLFCFGTQSIVEVSIPAFTRVGLVSDANAVRQRLVARDALARQLFPAYQPIWERWRRRVEGAGRGYLKLDAFGIADTGPDDHDRWIRGALAWFDSHRPEDGRMLTYLAGLDADAQPLYPDDPPEDFLIGWRYPEVPDAEPLAAPDRGGLD